MKLLFDQNLSFRLCIDLGDLFPESNHVRLVGLSQASDDAIWNFASANGHTIVSQDADFADMSGLRRGPKVIWLRTGNQPQGAVAALLRSHAATIEEFGADAEAACLEIYGNP